MANRERHIIHTVACPDCGASIGQSCRWTGAFRLTHGSRLAVHGLRKEAWQRLGNPRVELPPRPPKKMPWIPFYER